MFNAKLENRDAPKRLTADELQVELEKVRHITPGNHPGNGSGKRKRGTVEERLLFTHRSTLWDLEYWKYLDLRLRESWIRESTDSRTIYFGRTVGP